MKLEVDQVSTFDLRPVRFFEIDVNADVNVTTDNLILEGGASLELFKTALGAAAGDPLARSGFVAFDLLGGARYNNLKITSDIEVDIREDFDPKFIPLRITREQRIVRRIEQDNSWVDPFVGGRVRMETPGGLQIFARGDVGGFHVGSDFVWNVIGGVGGGVWFCNCEQLTWLLAYRALDTDYVTGSGFERFNYDMLIHGPISGVTYRF